VSDNPIVRDIGFIVVAAMLFVALGRVARIPSIVSYILAGLVLGPMLGLVGANEPLEVVSEAGIALLLFLVGLEISFDKVRDVGRVAVYAGLGQVVFTAVGGFGLAFLLGFPWVEGLFIAIALTFSSTVVVVKLLDEKNEIDSLYGRIAVGIFLVQDVVVIIFLTALAGLIGVSSVSPADVAVGIALAFAGMAALLATTILASRFVLPRVLGWMTSHEALFIASLCWCFLLVLGAEALRLSLEIGAFMAGVGLAQLPYATVLRRRVHPLVNFFIAIFFVSLGIQMRLGAAGEHAVAIAVFSLFVLIGNPLIFIWIITRSGFGERTAFLAGVTVAQISEFSFIFAALGLSAGLIDEATLSLIGVVGLITIGASAYMIIYNHGLYEWCRGRGLLRLFRAPPEPDPKPEQRLRDHVIVVGMNPLGRRIVQELHARGEHTLAVDTDPGKLQEIPGRTLLGNVNYLSVLEEAGLSRAKLLVSALQIEDSNRLLAFRCAERGVRSSIHAFDQSLVPELTQLGASHVMESRSVGLERVLDALHDAGVYGS
jgi:Kef-type K+ transport system membrane component KefB